MRAFFRFAAAIALPATFLACAGRITNVGGSGGHLTGGGSGNSTAGNTGGISGGGAGDSGAASGTGGTGTGATGTGATGTGGMGTGGTGTGGGTNAACPPVSQSCPTEIPSVGCPCGMAGMGCSYSCPGDPFANPLFATCLSNGRWQVDTVCTMPPACDCNPGEVCFGKGGSPDFIYSCVPDPCAPAPLSCTCGGKMICGGWPTECSIPAAGTVACAGP